MKLQAIMLTLFCLGLAGCGSDSGQSSKPASPEEYTTAIIKEVQEVIRSTDRQLSSAEPSRSMAVPMEESGQKRSLKLWMENGNPVKLTATEPGPEGKMSGLSAFYFANGELFFASQHYGRLIFIDGKLKYWLGQDWQPMQVPEASRQQREEYLLAKAREYLQAFDEAGQ